MDGRAFYGNVLFSTGPNTELGGTNDTACHLDLPMKGCTLYLDDELVVKDGTVVPQDMRAPGYQGRYCVSASPSARTSQEASRRCRG